MSDLLSRIDELIDEQLEAGEPEVGYSFGDPQFPRWPDDLLYGEDAPPERVVIG